MRLKSLRSRVTNQRIIRTCVVNIFMLCSLSTVVWSNANIKHERFVRQVNDETAANYEDFAMTNSYHQPHFTENRSVVVQLFEWKFADIATECRDFLGPQGYAGVQLSPVLEHTVIKNAELNHPWWERYEVVSYRFSSRSGDESEFWSMSRICNEHGVRIYADVILNHMAAPLHFVDGATAETDNAAFIVNTLLETSVNISQQCYSNVPYTQLDFHQPPCMVLDNAQDAHKIRNCQLNGHPDLDHSRGHVQKLIVEMLNKYVDMGVAGFRIDTAKYIWPIDLKKILQQVKNLSTEFDFKKNSRPFVYHDVFDFGLDTVSKTEYSTYGVVSEYLYPAELSNILRGKVALSSLINWGPALGFLPHEDSLVFIDSHDTQRGLPAKLGSNKILNYKQRVKYIKANVFMLVHPYGAIKRVMSSYYFPDTNINQGPPGEEADEEEIRSPKFNKQNQCTKESGWVCEHRWPELVNMIKVANYFKKPGHKEESIIYFQTNGANQVAFCRGYKAFVAINNDPEKDFVKDVYACLEPGMYCDVVTGGKKEGKEECHGKILEINDERYTKLAVNVADDSGVNEIEEEIDTENEEEEEESGKVVSYGIIVIYAESKVKPAEKKDVGGEGLEDGKESAVAEGEQLEAKENNDAIETKETENLNGDSDGEENQIKENAEENNSDNEDGNQGDDQKDDKDEVQEETKIGQTEEVNDNEAEQVETEGLGEEKSAAAETDVEDTDNAEEVSNDEANVEGVGETDVEDTEGDKNQSKENTKEVANDHKASDGNDQEDVNEENGTEQSEEIDNQQPVEEEAVNKSIEENNVKFIEENVDEESLSDTKGSNDADNSSKEKESNENAVREGEDIKNDAANSNDEKNTEEQDGKAEEGNEEINPDSVKNSENEVESEQAAVEAEDNVQETEKNSQNSDDSGNNQSRNLDEIGVETEEQIEKPSAEVVDDVADAVTAKIQDIQTAGFISNPKGSKNGG